MVDRARSLYFQSLPETPNFEILVKDSNVTTMPKTKSDKDTQDATQARLAAAHHFKRGDRVRHKVTNQLGVFQELNLGFALPEVWVQFDSVREIAVTLFCNPLDLEKVDPSSQEREIHSGSELANVEKQSVVDVEVLEELTESEAKERHRLELKVERAFYEAAIALRELHERKLYRSTHSRFDHYCRDRFGFSQQNADLLIRAAGVIDNLKVTTIGCKFLPTNERQVRPLTKLEANEQRQVWQRAVEFAGNRIPSGRVVRDIIVQLKQKELFPITDFCQVGDAFTLMKLEGVERKYNGYPCVATKLKDFTIEVEVFDGTLAVKPENLRLIDDPDVCRQLPATIRRIGQLRQVGVLDRGAEAVLQHLGRQTYLTDLEVELLTFLEQRYGAWNPTADAS